MSAVTRFRVREQLTTGQNEVRRAQHYVGERLQEAKVDQVGEEASSHHQQGEPFKQIQTCQHGCGKLGTIAQTLNGANALKSKTTVNLVFYSP